MLSSKEEGQDNSSTSKLKVPSNDDVKPGSSEINEESASLVLAATYNGLGLYFHHTQGDQKSALRYHLEALRFLQKKNESSSKRSIHDSKYRPNGQLFHSWDVDHLPIEVHIALTLTDIGNVHKKEGDYPQAIKAYEEALRIFYNDCNLTDSHPRIMAIHRAVSQINRCSDTLYMSDNQKPNTTKRDFVDFSTFLNDAEASKTSSMSETEHKISPGVVWNFTDQSIAIPQFVEEIRKTSSKEENT